MGKIKGIRTFCKGHELTTVFANGHKLKFAFGHGTQFLPSLPYELSGFTEAKIVKDNNKVWFEVGFKLDMSNMGGLVGNCFTGWGDVGSYLKLDLEYSTDLVNWSMGKFIPSTNPVIDFGNNIYEYWSRALNPQDAMVKSAEIAIRSGNVLDGTIGAITGDARNNPITAVTVAGVSLALGGFPYTMGMAGEDARMQAALRAFYPTATVVAADNINWSIVIPGVNLTTYTQQNSITWPTYLIADMFGVVNTPMSGCNFGGSWVDASGMAICPKAFARLKIQRGIRYDPYYYYT